MAELTLWQLAEQAGLPPRTIRFYIARGLLPGPRKGGRRAVYGPEHLERLGRIRELQAQGYTLAEIARLLAADGQPNLPQPTSWWCYPVAEDVQVWVRGDVKPWRAHRIRQALLRMMAELEISTGGNTSLDNDGNAD